jgi:hypothetical protein
MGWNVGIRWDKMRWDKINGIRWDGLQIRWGRTDGRTVTFGLVFSTAIRELRTLEGRQAGRKEGRKR